MMKRIIKIYWTTQINAMMNCDFYSMRESEHKSTIFVTISFRSRFMWQIFSNSFLMVFNFHYLSPDGMFGNADPRFFCLISSYSQPTYLRISSTFLMYAYFCGMIFRRIAREFKRRGKHKRRTNDYFFFYLSKLSTRRNFHREKLWELNWILSILNLN